MSIASESNSSEGCYHRGLEVQRERPKPGIRKERVQREEHRYSSLSSLSGASEPGWASDAWLRGYRASWAEEQAEYKACLSCLTVGGSYEISFVKVSAD